MTGFILKNTFSDNGGVTRGLYTVENGHIHVTNIMETKNIVKTENGAEVDGVNIDLDSYVSMNFWGFPREPLVFFNVLEDGFKECFKKDVVNNPL